MRKVYKLDFLFGRICFEFQKSNIFLPIFLTATNPCVLSVLFVFVLRESVKFKALLQKAYR